MSTTTPAQLYCTLVGAALVIGGIIGFFYDASFDTGLAVTSEDVFGVLAVNGWHNLVHIATGLLGLLAAGYAARTYALAFGLIYVILAIWGFAIVEDGVGTLVDLIPINTEDNFFHLIIGLTGLGAGAASQKPAGPANKRERLAQPVPEPRDDPGLAVCDPVSDAVSETRRHDLHVFRIRVDR